MGAKAWKGSGFPVTMFAVADGDVGVVDGVDEVDDLSVWTMDSGR